MTTFSGAQSAAFSASVSPTSAANHGLGFGAPQSSFATPNFSFGSPPGNQGANEPIKKKLVSAPPLASAATVTDPTTEGAVADHLRRRAAQARKPIISTGVDEASQTLLGLA